MGQLRIALLGTPDVAHAGGVLALPSRKALALLAYLAVEAACSRARSSLRCSGPT